MGHTEDSLGIGFIVQWVIQRTVWGQGSVLGNTEDSLGTGLVQWVIQRTVWGQG